MKNLLQISNIKRIEFRNDINGLRAIAVLAVVFYHAELGVLYGGWLGVDIFLVISGYLISNIIISELNLGIFSFRNFYMRRIKRIIPGLFFALLLTIPFSYFLLSPKAMTEYINSLKLLENYDINYFAPGHGNYMEDPSKTIQSIIRHRLSRESKVLRCIDKNNNPSLDELLPLVYDDVPEMLHPIARMSLMAHLIKLQDEEKIKSVENRYSSS